MFIFRGFFYLFAVAGVAHLIALEGYQFGAAAEYGEHTLTEHMQDFMTFFTCMFFLYAARMDAKLNIAATLLSALSAMMFVRESDSLLDHYVFDGAWQVIVLLIFACVIVFLWGRFSSIYASLKEYSLQPSFGTYLAGFVTLMAFSRLFGRGSFWQSVMGDDFSRLVKNIIEEGVETLGYTLMLIAAMELVIACYKRSKERCTENN